MSGKNFLALLAAVALVCGAVGCKADTDTGQADTSQIVQETEQVTEQTAETMSKQTEQADENSEVKNEIDIYAQSDSEYIGIGYGEFSDDYSAIEIESDRFSLSDLSYSENLKRLTIYKLGNDDLSGIENFPNLEYLAINDDCVKDISALSGLKKLNTIWIRFTSSIEDYSVLSEIENLNEFGAILCNDGGTMPHIEAIGNCSKLEKLYLQGFTIDNIDFIRNLKELKSLRLWSYKTSIEDISPLTELNKLEELEITYHSYDMELFGNMTSMQRLSIDWDVKEEDKERIKKFLTDMLPECEISIDYYQ